jgi:hypothetical protein
MANQVIKWADQFTSVSLNNYDDESKKDLNNVVSPPESEYDDVWCLGCESGVDHPSAHSDACNQERGFNVSR